MALTSGSDAADVDTRADVYALGVVLYGARRQHAVRRIG
jgi:hypothetical protein